MTNNRDTIVGLLKKGSSKKLEPPSKKDPILNTPSDSLQAHELDDDYHKKVAGKGEHWGYHLLVDCSECNKNIDDVEAVEDFLYELVEALDMKRIGKPIVVKVSGEDGRGVSGLQLITTSNIAFHGDDDEWSAYIDVFSCKVFDPEIALKLIQKCFEPKKLGKFWVYRDAGKWPEK